MSTESRPDSPDALALAWRAVDKQADRLRPLHLRALLRDGTRPERMTLQAAGLSADFSKQRIDDASLSALFELAAQADLESACHRLFDGAVMNPTEGRPALHTALRGVGGGEVVAAQVAEQRTRMAALADQFRAGQFKGFDGTPLRTLVCIGIGGSDLGPRMVCDALRDPTGPDVRFVANVDPSDLHLAIAGLDPRQTAFAVVSKTFTTRETLANADAARAWLAAAGATPAQIRQHLIGITAAPAAAEAWGIDAERLLAFWDWVGGRYSLWATVGFPIAVACGNTVHAAMLDGAADMDRHFRDTPLTGNLPVWLGLLSIWNRTALGLPTQAIIPYTERLRLLPAWAQQLIMESNGKSARLDGSQVGRATSPVIWGVSGTNGQHSFFQQLHQGPDVVPVDFILPRAPEAALAARFAPGAGGSQPADPRHLILQANCLAQSAALALGKPLPGEAGGPDDWHRAFPGNRPSTTILLPRVDGAAVGALLSAYEHATFVASIVLGINAFDQFGVEYGKVLAKTIETELAAGTAAGNLDPSTAALIRALRN